MKVWITRIVRSRTLWLNAIFAILGAAEASFGLLQPYVAGNVYAYGMFTLTVGNAFLRFATTKPLKEK